MKDSHKKILSAFGVILVAIALHFYISERDKRYRSEVLNGIHIPGKARIDKLVYGDQTGIPTLAYNFIHGGRSYFRYVTLNYKNKGELKPCYYNKSLCEDYRFWIIYLEDDPEKSLIDLSCIMNEPLECPFPKNLEKFY